MTLNTPESFVADFEKYAEKAGVPLGLPARQLVLEFEQRAKSIDTWLDPSLILAVLIREIPQLRATLLRHGIDPVTAADTAESEVLTHNQDKYRDINDDLYRNGDNRGTRSLFGSATITRARSAANSSIGPLELLGGLLDFHDGIHPAISNEGWTDKALQVPFNTLAHIFGRFRKELWIPIETLKKELKLLTPEAMRREPIESAPAHVRNGLLSFFAEHPDYNKNCFLIMPFRASPQLALVHATIAATLSKHGLKLLRADDYVYSENVFTNIEVFLHGCRFGISVIERMASDQHNANVALEIGYLLGLKKEVCLLKERTVPALPSDLQGRLYMEFDAFSIEQSVCQSINRWLRDRRLLSSDRDC